MASQTESSAKAEKKRNRNRRHAEQGHVRSVREQIVFLSVLLLFILVSIYLDRTGESQIVSNSVPVKEGWMTEQNEIMDLASPPPGILTVTRDIRGLLAEGKSLCLKSIDTEFDVYADGTCVYSYYPEIPERFGKSYGMYVHTIELPESTAVLGLHLEPVFSGASAALNDICIEDGGQYTTRLFRDNLLSFMRSTLTLMIGLLFLIIGIFGRILMNTAGLDFISFGMLCLLLGFTGFNDTLLLQVLTGHPAIIRVLVYVCLIFLPYPMLSFFFSASGNSHSRIVPASLVLCLVNFICQVLLTHEGISDYFCLVYISHGIILLSLAVSFYIIIHSARQHRIQKELLRVLTIGLFACIVGSFIDISRYYLFQSYGSSGYTRIGVLVFTMLMGFYLFQEQTRALKQKQKENAQYISEITTAFSKVIDMKDSYTNGHSARVATYTAMLARELGYDEETVERYYRMAQLHDVGKIGIPNAVLNKPGKLTDEEYEIIKSHTTKGYDILKDISIMPELATGARSHHERPDGLGYPGHLKGEEIPRVAQIIAVADSFDAMYSKRPYRERMNFEKVVAIIRSASGTQLTPDVVDAFCGWWRRENSANRTTMAAAVWKISKTYTPVLLIPDAFRAGGIRPAESARSVLH